MDSTPRRQPRAASLFSLGRGLVGRALLGPALLASALLAPTLAAAPLTAQRSDSWDVTATRGELRQIDFTTDEGTWLSVDVSPDGSWMVFDLLGHVYRAPTSGGGAEAAVSLTQASGAAMNYHPRISPDGRTIVWVATVEGDQYVVEERQVKTGLTFDGSVEIIEGLSAGERVVMKEAKKK